MWGADCEFLFIPIQNTDRRSYHIPDDCSPRHFWLFWRGAISTEVPPPPRFLCSWPPAHTICLMTSWLVMTQFWDSLTTNPFANGKEKKFFRFLCFLLKWESSPCCDPLQHTDRNDYWDIKKNPISINKNYFLWSTAHWHLKYNAVTFFSVIDVFTRCWCHR